MEEFQGEELALLVHNHFPALSGERDVLHALSRSAVLERLFEVLYRTRPDRSADLAALEAALAPSAPSPAEPTPAEPTPPPGQRLYDAVLSGALTRNAALQVILQVADGLQHRQRAHGALNPHNILLVDSHPPVLTADAPHGDFYRPFEASTGDGEDVRIDVYSLARTAVFCLHQAPLPPRAAHEFA